MKVLWITPVYPNEYQPYSGVFCQIQAHHIADLGLVPEIVVPVPYVPPLVKWMNQRYGFFNSMAGHAEDGPIHISRVRYITSPLEYVFGVSHVTQRLAISALNLKKPNLIHAHFAYPVGAAAIDMAKKWKIPLILTLYGDDVTIHPYVSRWHLRRFQRTVRQSDMIIALSEALADETEELSGRKPRVLSSGVDMHRFGNLPNNLSMRKKHGISSDDFVVTYIGNLLIEKGVLDLVAAFERCNSNHSRLIFIGDGPDKPTGPLIMHFGKRPNQDIPQFLAMADVLVLPSHHEGLGQVILEAGAAGKPVVGASTGGIKNLLSDDRGWLFNPKDTHVLARCLDEVKQNSQEAKRRGNRLKTHIMEYHSPSKNASTLIKWYRSLIQQNNRLPS